MFIIRLLKYLFIYILCFLYYVVYNIVRVFKTLCLKLKTSTFKVLKNIVYIHLSRYYNITSIAVVNFNFKLLQNIKYKFRFFYLLI